MSISAEVWTVIASLAGSSVVAAIVTYALKLRGDRRRQTSLKHALLAEIAHAEDHAQGYLRLGTPRSPVWRISTLLYPQAVTGLLALGVIHEPAIKALLTYYGHIQSLNRALDEVDEHTGTERYERFVRRAIFKATLLVSERHIRVLRKDPLMKPFTALLEKRLRVHADGMPLDRVLYELRLVPGSIRARAAISSQ